MLRTRILALAAAGLLLAAPRTAAAFCGFFVSGADAKLYNNATQVVLMREGTRTVLSMQNNYQGPPEDFALVVPVPVVLQEQDVKTLPRSVFDRVDQLAAPRLVEYWEQDPCPPRERRRLFKRYSKSAPLEGSSSDGGGGGYGVTIEAQFTVGEYQILVLGAQDSSGLDAWLRDHNYKIPPGAGEVLRPYVQAGMKFFVAKVDITKVQVDPAGRTMLSPLRFHYDSDSFTLPVRLGLLNARGKQDLIVHVLARDLRYEVANYKNVAIPTNIEVADATRNNFSGFYASLFDRVLEHHPGAVITEYAWMSSSCDPCPVDPLQPPEISLLGGDVTSMDDNDVYRLVLTRLHARYGAESLGEDLVFRAGEPIVGGREASGPEDNEVGATPSSYNNFQARYIIRHPWTGPIKCRNPQRGRWGGPSGNEAIAARDTAFVARDAPLAPFLKASLADTTVLPGAERTTSGPLAPLDAGPPVSGSPPPLAEPAPSGCARCDIASDAPLLGLATLALAGLGLRRRPR